eukprot:CAMPEP_0172715746 /NCGR_PEP_ID=MMETSP1074-20121228/67720_1 /TAXON_ID=2916 /ORGANISM="Ceratium fusus, Strain PA161109" /LENGTH=591 /DNA_ID=CAMNT_0013540353 /DNA_START=129 /DNA_END=1904 /DNA_ORIENTATION=+
MPKSSSSLPKYSIRVGLAFVIPVVSALLGCALLFPFLVALALVPLEVPKVRQALCSSRIRKNLPCLRVPALLRLSVLWVLQLWWIMLCHARSSMASIDAPLSDVAATELVWTPQTLSVVLPCAGEGEFALKTVKSVYESVPEEILQEIVVVDDGSNPPLADSYLDESVRIKYRIVLVRHDETQGLINAKKDGGKTATGDVIVFFDCHVAPQKGWYSQFFALIAENYRRIVVPVITDLDVGTWTQRGGSHGQSKCYMTWDVDFKWFNSPDPYVPVLSGGLLGISRRWWNETGGYDEGMAGWGGENLDQSLRSWLCGGEIMLAEKAFVAHMWRVPTDPRTKAKYMVKAGTAQKNRMRAAAAWFGDFTPKLSSFPSLQADRQLPEGSPWYGNVDNILEVKQRLQCRGLEWFLHRFKHVYEDGGLVPSQTYAIRAIPSGLCLTYLGQPGTSPDGFGKVVLQKCADDNERQRWHGANRDTSKEGEPCCSGLRAWNTDQCIIGGLDGRTIKTFVCDISGHNQQQRWQLTADGQLKQKSGGFMSNGECLMPDSSGGMTNKACLSSGVDQLWRKEDVAQPLESRIYQKAMAASSDQGVA